MAGYVRVYTGEDGETHFVEVPVELRAADYAPPAAPLNVSQPYAAQRLVFVGGDPGWVGGWHPSPVRQLVFVLTGAFEVTVSDGETRVFHAGDVALLDDTKGKGHYTRVTSTEAALVAMCHLADAGEADGS